MPVHAAPPSRPAVLPPPADARTLDWGRTEYQDARRRQEGLVRARLAGGGADVLVLTEHDPVFTVGLRIGAERHLLWDAERLRRENIRVESAGRGGDITYHGPGQLVGYPIVSLDGRRDLHAYLRFLEDVLIDTVGRVGLSADRRPGLTGIWIGKRKVAAIGVAVRRWVAFHGFALNVDPDLRAFEGIVPCGIAPGEGTVTSLRAELGVAPDPKNVAAAAAAAFWERLPRFLAPDRPVP